MRFVHVLGWVLAMLFAGLWLGKQTEVRVQYPDVSIPSVWPQVPWQPPVVYPTSPSARPSTVEPHPATTWISTTAWDSRNVTPTQ